MSPDINSVSVVEDTLLASQKSGSSTLSQRSITMSQGKGIYYYRISIYFILPSLSTFAARAHNQITPRRWNKEKSLINFSKLCARTTIGAFL